MRPTSLPCRSALQWQGRRRSIHFIAKAGSSSSNNNNNSRNLPRTIGTTTTKSRKAPSRGTPPVSHQARHFTFPDLSQLSLFKSTTETDKEKNSNENDDCETYRETVVIPFPKSLLFQIVSNVDEYEHFVPYCVSSKVDRGSEKEIDDRTKQFLAELTIGYGQLREAYTSQVTIVEGKSVQATAIPTPLFKRLETTWTFRDDGQHPKSNSPNTTKVDFQIDYAFSNPFYAAFARTAMEKMTSKMIDAFTARAREQQQQTIKARR